MHKIVYGRSRRVRDTFSENFLTIFIIYYNKFFAQKISIIKQLLNMCATLNFSGKFEYFHSSSQINKADFCQELWLPKYQE